MPSTAWSRTRTRGPSISTTSTGCRPIGFGRSAEPRAEHAPQRVGDVVARMHAQHVAARAVKPGDDDHGVARADPVQALEHCRLEHQHCLGRALVSLLGRRRRIRQRRLDVPDRAQLEAVAQPATDGSSPGRPNRGKSSGITNEVMSLTWGPSKSGTSIAFATWAFRSASHTCTGRPAGRPFARVGTLSASGQSGDTRAMNATIASRPCHHVWYGGGSSARRARRDAARRAGETPPRHRGGPPRATRSRAAP